MNSTLASALNNLQEYTELLLSEVGDPQAPEFNKRLQRLPQAVDTLRRRIEEFEQKGCLGNPTQAECKTLRHDIRNWLTGIKFTAQWLIEVLNGRHSTRSLATLEALFQEATTLEQCFRPVGQS